MFGRALDMPLIHLTNKRQISIPILWNVPETTVISNSAVSLRLSRNITYNNFSAAVTMRKLSPLVVSAKMLNNHVNIHKQ